MFFVLLALLSLIFLFPRQLQLITRDKAISAPYGYQLERKKPVQIHNKKAALSCFFRRAAKPIDPFLVQPHHPELRFVHQPRDGRCIEYQVFGCLEQPRYTLVATQDLVTRVSFIQSTTPCLKRKM